MKFHNLFVVALCFSIASITSAHEGDCPYCKLKLVQNTPEQDNEVVLRFGNKKIEYRCIFCVFKDQKRYKGDLVVYAPSEKVGEPVILKRTEGKWTGPDGVVFLNSFKKHVDCAALSRAFSNSAAYDAYVKKNDLKDTKAFTLVEFIDFVVKPAK